jgi:hypothetical protein
VLVGAESCTHSAPADHSDYSSQAATLEEELTTIARAAELFKSLRE